MARGVDRVSLRDVRRGGRSPQTLQAQWGALDPDAQQNYIRQYSAASPKMQASVRDAFYGPGGQPGGVPLDRPVLEGGMGPAATAALARGVPDQVQDLRGALGGGYQTQLADLGAGAGGVQNLMARQNAKRARAAAGAPGVLGGQLGDLSTGLTRNPNATPGMPGPAAGTAVAGGVGGGYETAGAAGAQALLGVARPAPQRWAAGPPGPAQPGGAPRRGRATGPALVSDGRGLISRRKPGRPCAPGPHVADKAAERGRLARRFLFVTRTAATRRRLASAAWPSSIRA